MSNRGVPLSKDSSAVGTGNTVRLRPQMPPDHRQKKPCLARGITLGEASGGVVGGQKRLANMANRPREREPDEHVLVLGDEQALVKRTDGGESAAADEDAGFPEVAGCQVATPELGLGHRRWLDVIDPAGLAGRALHD